MNLVRNAKLTYYNACIESNKGDSKKLWQYLRDLVQKENKTLPSNLKVGNKIITNPTEISEYLPEPNENIPSFTKFQEFIVSKIHPHDTFSIPQLSVDEVTMSLLSLDIHKSTGPDGLSAKLLNISAPLISTSLTYIFNHSTSHGKYPNQWKTSRINLSKVWIPFRH